MRPGEGVDGGEGGPHGLACVFKEGGEGGVGAWGGVGVLSGALPLHLGGGERPVVTGVGGNGGVEWVRPCSTPLLQGFVSGGVVWVGRSAVAHEGGAEVAEGGRPVHREGVGHWVSDPCKGRE